MVCSRGGGEQYTIYMVVVAALGRHFIYDVYGKVYVNQPLGDSGGGGGGGGYGGLMSVAVVAGR